MRDFRSFLFLGLLGVLLGCAPPKMTPQEKAKSDAYFAAQKARAARQKAEFDANVLARTAADKNAPPRVHDPGYPAGRCISPAPRPGDYALTAPLQVGGSASGVICDNSEAGLKVLAWREWYCRGIEPDSSLVRACVIRSWESGYPSGGIVTEGVEFSLPAGKKLAFGPSTWQPGAHGK